MGLAGLSMIGIAILIGGSGIGLIITIPLGVLGVTLTVLAVVKGGIKGLFRFGKWLGK